MGDSEGTSTEHSRISEEASGTTVWKQVDLGRETTYLEPGQYKMELDYPALVYFDSALPGNPFVRQELPVVHAEKCPCQQLNCNTYGLDFGTFYQGAGWHEAEALEIAKRINMHPFLTQAIKMVMDEPTYVGFKIQTKQFLIEILRQCGHNPREPHDEKS